MVAGAPLLPAHDAPLNATEPYEKLDAHYLAFVQLASVMVWLGGFGGMS